MIIGHVTIIAESLTKFCGLMLFLQRKRAIFLYNKQNNILMLGNRKFISRVDKDISFA